MIKPKLLFIYNADSERVNSILDSLHTLLQPDSYSCALCNLTYGALGERKAWKNFRKNSSVEMEFLHKDEYQKQYASKFNSKFEFPIVLIEEYGEFQVFISSEELKMIKDDEALIALIENRL